MIQLQQEITQWLFLETFSERDVRGIVSFLLHNDILDLKWKHGKTTLFEPYVHLGSTGRMLSKVIVTKKVHYDYNYTAVW